MPQDVWIKFYGRGMEKTPQCYNKIKKPSAYRVKATPMKLCRLLVPRNAHQNTERNFQKSDLLRHDDVANKTMGKF